MVSPRFTSTSASARTRTARFVSGWIRATTRPFAAARSNSWCCRATTPLRSNPSSPSTSGTGSCARPVTQATTSSTSIRAPGRANDDHLPRPTSPAPATGLATAALLTRSSSWAASASRPSGAAPDSSRFNHLCVESTLSWLRLATLRRRIKFRAVHFRTVSRGGSPGTCRRAIPRAAMQSAQSAPSARPPLWVWRLLLGGFAVVYLASETLQAWLPPLLPFLAAVAVEAQFFVAGLRQGRRPAFATCSIAGRSHATWRSSAGRTGR